jgi:hypothetical protein
MIYEIDVPINLICGCRHIISGKGRYETSDVDVQQILNGYPGVRRAPAELSTTVPCSVVTPEPGVSRRPIEVRQFSDLRDIHKGETCYIVGMGASLLQLTPDYFKDGFIVATYESIYKIESFNLPNPVYSMQKDTITGLPGRSPLLLHAHESARQNPDYEPCYVFDNPRDFGGRRWDNPSGVISSCIAHWMGAGHITILCFDRTTHGDFRRPLWVNGEYTLNAPLDLVLSDVRKEVEEMAKQRNVKVDWVTPQ